MNILSLFFGSPPDIYDAKGTIVHKLPEDRWADWKKRFSQNSDLDWRNHQGTKRVVKTPGTIKKSP